jgi:triosephosphate isomerase (TIM)
MLKRPVVIVNLKTYPQATGEGALRIAQAAARVAEETGAGMAIAPQAADIRLVRDAGVPVFAQHAQPRTPGSNTGYDLAPALKGAGAVGTLINHAEHRLTLADVSAAVEIAKAMDWQSVVCTDTTRTSAAAAALSPDFVAVEPPELIGGDVSVTSADPDIVSGARDAVKRVSSDVRLLCGAGVKTGDDVAAALELGADGVLLASGVAKAKDPEAALRGLLEKV